MDVIKSPRSVRGIHLQTDGRILCGYERREEDNNEQHAHEPIMPQALGSAVNARHSGESIIVKIDGRQEAN